jgi:deazaflavin-dependent oxidoreductase (nitroreductase family)
MTATLPRPDFSPQPGSPRPAVRAPRFVLVSNSLTSRLLRAGLPMGPNTLITVRGRSSGLPRSAPVAIMRVKGRRFVIGAYGDVQWVRNLRAAGEGTIREHGHDVAVTARELDQAEAVEFFGKTLPGYIARFPWVGRKFADVLFGFVGPQVLDDPHKAAQTRPVFELTTAAC